MTDSVTYSWQLQLVGAVTLIVASLLGISAAFLLRNLLTPTISTRRRNLLVGLTLALKGVGAGVVISTALVHLINEAYDYLDDGGWGSEFDAFPMVLAMVGLLGMAITDFVVYQHHHKDGETSRENSRASDLESEPICDATSGSEAGSLPIYGTASAAGQKDTVDDHALEDGRACTSDQGTRRDMHDLVRADHGHSPSRSIPLEQKRHTAVFVECTLVVHSVLIGFDLGLQNESGWKTLVIAISFHQFFEGLALGQLIAEAEYEKPLKSVLVALSFSFSTTVGIVIGILVRVSSSTSDEEMSTGVSTLVGVLNSLCGGILLYTGIVHLLLPWFVHNSALRVHSPWTFAFIAFFFVALGMAMMAIVGIWA